jgi:hypothetical protein
MPAALRLAAAAAAAALLFLPGGARAQDPTPSASPAPPPWGAGRLQMPFPPPPSSIAAVAAVLLGLCCMLGVLALDGHGMYQAYLRREEEEARAAVLRGAVPKRRMSVAEMFGFGGQSHFRQGAVKIDRKIVNQRRSGGGGGGDGHGGGH